MSHQSVKLTSVSVARIYVQRANGSREVHYAPEAVPIWHLRRRLKLARHLRFMHAEDRRAGWK